MMGQNGLPAIGMQPESSIYITSKRFQVAALPELMNFIPELTIRFRGEKCFLRLGSVIDRCTHGYPPPIVLLRLG